MTTLVGDILIPHEPVPQGSMRMFPSGGMQHTNKDALMGFRSDVAMAWQSMPLLETEAVVLYCVFTFTRPKSHYLPPSLRKSRPHPVLRDDAPIFHTKSPDVDKLLRAVMDALTGRAYRDDEQVVVCTGAKEWGPFGRTRIEVSRR